MVNFLSAFPTVPPLQGRDVVDTGALVYNETIDTTGPRTILCIRCRGEGADSGQFLSSRRLIPMPENQASDGNQSVKRRGNVYAGMWQWSEHMEPRR